LKVTYIVGLPASGKSFLGNTMKGDHSAFVDDPTNLDWLSSEEILGCSHLIITDPSFCNYSILEKANALINTTFQPSSIETIYFENDPEQCKKNSLMRENKKVTGYIDLLTGLYEIPQDVIPRSVFRGLDNLGSRVE
jgi:hypothetical protein